MIWATFFIEPILRNRHFSVSITMKNPPLGPSVSYSKEKGLNFKSVLFYAVDIVKLILSPSFKMQLQQKKTVIKSP